jgi:FkbM family methyltransferase
VNEEKTMQSSKYSSFLNPKGESIKVAMRTLESYLKEQNLDYIDLVKMDIEGMEFEVLESWDDKLLEKI